MTLKLNLGCGFARKDGWVNVDSSPTVEPDTVVDLNHCPWPWNDNAADAVYMSHVLEHLGPTAEEFLAIMTELWRVCAPDAEITITVPHPRHDSFLNDPTHIRPITPEGLLMFSRKQNLVWRESGAGNTPLALMLGIDLEITALDHTLEEPWLSQMQAGLLDRADLIAAEKQYNNVISQTTLQLRAKK